MEVRNTNNTNSKTYIAGLQVEGIVAPLCLDKIKPRFNWQLSSSLFGVRQQSYQILVADSKESLRNNVGNCWNSGRRQGESSLFIPYEGIPLQSRHHYYWKVRVSTGNDAVTGWSDISEFEMGLLDPAEWRGKWIGYDGVLNKDEQPDSHFTRVYARYLSKDFESRKPTRRAIVYISGVGLFQLYINGHKVGDQVLQPGPTDYAKRVFYQRFDVGKLIHPGKNNIRVVLGNGRFVPLRQHLEDTTNNCVNYGFPKLLFQLELKNLEGKNEIVGSDESWKISAAGPIGANSEFDGEEYDARRTIDFSASPGMGNEVQWKWAQLVSPAAPVILAQPNPPIKIMDSITPKRRSEVGPRKYIFDLDQNMVGWARIHVRGNRGDTVKLRFAERLDEKGQLYTKNLGDARATDTYVMSGKGTETWEPAFTYHGFRFVEISGLRNAPALADVMGKVVHDALPLTGSIETSNPVLNGIYHNMFWGIRSNYRGMPTDCPQRDERMGWLGDRAAVALGESFMFDIHGLYSKWMQDIEDAQNTEGSIPDVAPAYWRMYTNNTTWPAAYVYCIRMLYRQYGDDDPIRLHYASIKHWLTFLRSHFMVNGIITENTYGDWCVPPESLTMIFSNDSTRKTPGNFLSSAFYCDMLNIMTEFAEVIHRPEDAAMYRNEWLETRKAINLTFLNAKDSSYANNTTTANLLALAFNIVPDDYRKPVFAHVVDNTVNKAGGHISTGLVGIQQLMRTITANGRPDLAFQLATTTTYPGWGYMLTQGASTIWELWNGNTASPEMNSANHVMMIGDLLTWYYEDLAGIKATAPGFAELAMHPLINDSLYFVNAGFNSPLGRIVSSWKKENGAFKWKVEIPANSVATLYVPYLPGQGIKVNNSKIGGLSSITILGQNKDRLMLRAVSGKYNFVVYW